MTPYHHMYPIMFPDRSVALHAMPTGCGRELVVSPAYRWDGMQRGGSELVIWQFTVSGEGGLDFNGESLRTRAGEGMLLIVPEEHVYYLPPESKGWEFIWISVSGGEAVRLARECRRRGGPIHRLAPDSQVLALERRFFALCSEKRLTDAWQASAFGYEFMLRLTEEYCRLGTGGAKLDFMRRINDYCMAHIDAEISVDELARRAGYSRWHFSRLFREYNGMSPMQYIIELKMRLAMQLLQNSKYPIKEIGLRCGFDDPGYFSKVFRRVYGISPGEFRAVR